MASFIDQLEFIKSSIEARVKSINGSRVYYRRMAFITFTSTAILAAVTTILLGMKVSEQYTESIRISALVITTLISLINIYNAFFNHKEMWIANNSALNKFYELGFNISYYEKGESLTQEAVDGFKESYQLIINELNQNWHKTRTESQSQ